MHWVFNRTLNHNRNPARSGQVRLKSSKIMIMIQIYSVTKNNFFK